MQDDGTGVEYIPSISLPFSRRRAPPRRAVVRTLMKTVTLLTRNYGSSRLCVPIERPSPQTSLPWTRQGHLRQHASLSMASDAAADASSSSEMWPLASWPPPPCPTFSFVFDRKRVSVLGISNARISCQDIDDTSIPILVCYARFIAPSLSVGRRCRRLFLTSAPAPAASAHQSAHRANSKHKIQGWFIYSY